MAPPQLETPPSRTALHSIPSTNMTSLPDAPSSTEGPAEPSPESNGSGGSAIAPELSNAADYIAPLSPEVHDAELRKLRQLVRARMPQETAADAGGLKFERDLGTILAGGIPEPEQLIDGLVYAKRVHWLMGHPGHGKTTVAMDVARQHMENGGHVIWFDWEAGIRPTVARLAAVGATVEQLDSQFHLATGPMIEASDAGFELIADALTEWPDALVVFDSASKALSLAGFDENSPTEATKWTTKIVLPTRDAGATVLVIDHVTKGATKTNPYPRGAGSKLADADMVWFVGKTKPFARDRVGAIELTNTGKDREGMMPKAVAFEVGDGNGRLPLTRTEVEESDGPSKRDARLRAKVQAKLEEHSSADTKLTGRQVTDLVSGKAAAIREALRELAGDPGAPVTSAPGPRSSVLFWHDPEAVKALPIR